MVFSKLLKTFFSEKLLPIVKEKVDTEVTLDKITIEQIKIQHENPNKC